MKKLICMTAMVLMIGSAIVGCSSKSTDPKQEGTKTNQFDSNKEITVVARDSASGTRGAFHELMGITVKTGDKQTDNLVVGALEFDGTDKVITAVEGNEYAIGYISLGSLSDRIKAAKVDGIEANAANVKDGSYKVSRPFLLVTKGTENELVKDFLSFAASKQGQNIVEEKKYIKSAEEEKEYTATGLKGTIKVAGSTSVSPLMEVLQEEYQKLNPDVKFETQANGSSQGIKAAMDGTYDIGMSSRELNDGEKSELNEHILAMDGIAVILNKDNPTSDIKSEIITDIYTGKATKWNEVEK